MSGKSLAVTLILAIVVAFGVGFLVGRSAQQGPARGLPPTPSAPKQRKVKIILKPGSICQQVDSGAGNPDKVPQLRRASGDTIIWEEGIAPGGPTHLVVTFPPTSNGHIGTPFVDANGNPKFTFTNGEVGQVGSGVPYDTYLFLSATVGGTACANPQDPGVIVTE
jgi:hypothetical protein